MAKIAVLLIFIISVFPNVSRAILITEGSIHITGPISGTFDFGNDDFHVSGGCGYGYWRPVASGPWAYPSSIPVDGGVSGGDFGTGYYESDSTGKLFVSWGNALQSSSWLHVTGDPIPLSLGTEIYTGNFSLSVGKLFGYVPSNHSYELSDADAYLPYLEGSGTVTILVQWLDWYGPPTAFSREANYTFTNPVPDPNSILLFGTGLIGLAIYGRKKLT